MKYAFIICLLFSGITLRAQHTGIKPTDWFTISGAVKNEVVISISDLLKYKQVHLGDVVVKKHRGDALDTIKGLSGILLRSLLDSVAIADENPKSYNEYYITLVASDGYKNVYSWNEIFNTPVGDHIYIITEMDGKSISQMPQRILVMSLSDFISGRRHLIGLTDIVFKKAG